MWYWEIRGSIIFDEIACLIRVRAGELKATLDEALSAARRVAKQLNLTVEE